MQNEGFRLIVRRGPQPNQVYELTSEVTNLGRDITNDIVINDREVSRHHLRLSRGANGVTIEDLGSTNGTFINGKRLTGAAALKNGDMVGLGETVTLQFEAARAGAAPEAPASDDDRYRPQAQEPAAQAPAPVLPPQPAPQAPADPYQVEPQAGAPAPEPQPEYQPQYQQQDAYAPPQDYYGGQAAAPAQASYGPPPPGYDYDPYAMREEGGNSTMQWLLIGCLGLLVVCCCATVALAVAVDTFCLYDLIPGLTDLLRGLNLAPQC